MESNPSVFVWGLLIAIAFLLIGIKIRINKKMCHGDRFAQRWSACLPQYLSGSVGIIWRYAACHHLKVVTCFFFLLFRTLHRFLAANLKYIFSTNRLYLLDRSQLLLQQRLHFEVVAFKQRSFRVCLSAALPVCVHSDMDEVWWNSEHTILRNWL